jgi:hypothetical protein
MSTPTTWTDAGVGFFSCVQYIMSIKDCEGNMLEIAHTCTTYGMWRIKFKTQSNCYRQYLLSSANSISYVYKSSDSPPFSAEVKECVELYLHSLITSSWRGAQLSTGTTLPLPYQGQWWQCAGKCACVYDLRNVKLKQMLTTVLEVDLT